jgi:hypothetical protein
MSSIKERPLPEKYMNRKMTTYPFKQMAIGDSFIISDVYSRHEMALKGNAARNWARKSKYCKKWRFSCKKTDDGKILITRISNKVIKRVKKHPESI